MARVLLLLPGTSYRAADFLQAAAANGIELVIATPEPPVLASLRGSTALQVDFDDPEEAARRIARHDLAISLDAVVAVDDAGTLVAAQAAALLGLPANPPAAVAAARDKGTLRGRLAQAEVQQPEFGRLDADATPDDVARLAVHIGFPCVVKPTRLSGSQGVIRADTATEAVAAAARAREIAQASGSGGALLIERFVPGAEVAVEALATDHGPTVLAVFDKPDPLDGPFFEETIYVTPSRLSAHDLDAVRLTLTRALRALDLRHGPVHAELRVEAGVASLIDIAPRTIGGLCARALRLATDDGVRRLEELVLLDALGRPLPPLVSGPTDTGRAAGGAAGGAAGVMMLPIPAAGMLQGVDGVEDALAVEGIDGLEITVAPGRPLLQLPEANRYLGFLFARGPDPASVEEALRSGHRRLTVRVDTEPAGDPRWWREVLRTPSTCGPAPADDTPER